MYYISMITVALIIASDTRSRGINKDETIPVVSDFLKKQGWKLIDTCIVPDDFDKLEHKMLYYADQLKVDLILTSGGTGFSRRDVTPEATRAVIEREAPGFGEIMRVEGFKITPNSILSRETAGIRGNTLIINLPGNPRGVVESLDIIKKAIPHSIEIIQGRRIKWKNN